MYKLFRRFAADTQGNIAIMAVGGMVFAVCCAALGVDIGSIAADRRKVQSAADIAAIVAASNITNATNAAKAAVVQNKLPAAALTTVELGNYSADQTIAPSSRFLVKGAAPANAVRVSMKSQTPLYFARFFTGSDYFDIRTTATATTTAIASFAIGSRLASLDGGVLNGILSSMLGTSVQLTVMDYQALLDARIDLFDFMTALASRVSLNALSYDQLLNTNLKIADVFAAALTAQQAASGVNAATSALSKVVSAVSSSSQRITPSNLIGFGPYSGMVPGDKPAAGATVSVLDLLTAAAGLAAGSSQVPVDLALNLPGIASVSMRLSVGERPQGASWVTLGSAGASVHTAQTRVLLDIKLIGAGIVPVVRLPVYIEVAQSTAVLSQVSCGYPNIDTTKVTLAVTPGVVDAWIAEVSDAQMKNFSVKPNPPAAVLVNLLNLVTVTGRAHAEMANLTPTNVEFSYADIQARLKKTVKTVNFTQSLTASLLGDLVVGVALGPLGLALSGIGGVVSGIIAAATAPIDQIISSLLSVLGIGLGQADVWVSGVRCDGAVLVN